MNKRVFYGIISVCCSLSASGAETAGRVDFSFKTKEGTAKHEPKHCLVVWVTDGDGNFVKTLRVNAKKRKKHLTTWGALEGKNEVDAITGATLKTHQLEQARWDCRDADGKLVADGVYQLHVEMTSRNMQGPVTSVQFVKGKKAVSLEPDDLERFTSIKLRYTPDE